jgi:hypothetical protein
MGVRTLILLRASQQIFNFNCESEKGGEILKVNFCWKVFKF